MNGPQETVYPGADERAPSRAQYFSWINNTNEGPTEAQTLANLSFFRYLHDEFGMVVDIYAFDAGAIDGAKFYGSTDSERFRRQFPRGFKPVYEAAKAMGCRLGVWGGPDGFGETPADARQRIDMMASLCRDFEFALFKMDAVCGQLRPEKEDAFVEMMTRCRQYSPDLILLNHRLQLGNGMPHATTWLWEGVETYIDVHIVNTSPAPHNRASALARGLPPGCQRLTEDHGVCLSSCLDFWEDDLVLQAFNRCLILAPEIYGNPWLLRDDELPRLARLFNLHRRYREILVDAIELPAGKFGPHALARGNGGTRLITLRNLTWMPVKHTIPLDATIGLAAAGPFEVRRLHPHERIVGCFSFGQPFEVEVLPFRACLLLVTNDAQKAGIGVEGCDYEVVRDIPGKPVELKLLGEPGACVDVVVTGCRERHRIAFPGTPLREPWHRRLGELASIPVPDDAEALYEATCFAADNNALEVRELLRSGPTAIPAVRTARDAFFNQPLFGRRNLWDANLFNDSTTAGFGVCRRWGRDLRVRGGAFRLDLGAPTRLDELVLEVGGDYELQPLKSEEGITGAVSTDLRTWRSVYAWADTANITLRLPGGEIVRYVRLDGCPDLIRKVRGFVGGRALDRSAWRASNLFSRYAAARATHAWSLPFVLDEAASRSYIAIAIHGECGNELAYAALRAGDGYAGAPRRSPSFPANTWECPTRPVNGNYTYYVPMTPNMIRRPLETVVLLLKGGNPDLRAEAWLTANDTPLVAQELVVDRK